MVQAERLGRGTRFLRLKTYWPLTRPRFRTSHDLASSQQSTTVYDTLNKRGRKKAASLLSLQTKSCGVSCTTRRDSSRPTRRNNIGQSDGGRKVHNRMAGRRSNECHYNQRRVHNRPPGHNPIRRKTTHNRCNNASAQEEAQQPGLAALCRPYRRRSPIRPHKLATEPPRTAR